jgi:hypothetical protein
LRGKFFLPWKRILEALWQRPDCLLIGFYFCFSGHEQGPLRICFRKKAERSSSDIRQEMEAF